MMMNAKIVVTLTYLLTYLLYDLNEKRKKKLFGDLDSLTHPLEPKNVDLFHFPWN